MKEITKSELTVMRVIWFLNRPVTMKEIRDTAESKFYKVWQPTTITTFLARLYKKGYITLSKRQGKYNYWKSIISVC